MIKQGQSYSPDSGNGSDLPEDIVSVWMIPLLSTSTRFQLKDDRYSSLQPKRHRMSLTRWAPGRERLQLTDRYLREDSNNGAGNFCRQTRCNRRDKTSFYLRNIYVQ